ncbi:MAG: UDP-3-O-acyl-N-acetylglucosamine deacetylase [candidate division WOR-3 bacterium]
MMGKKWTIQGNCLSGGSCRVDFYSSTDFFINIHKDGESSKILPTFKNISVENHTISIGEKVKVVEHLFSAFYGLNIFNIGIEIYGEELPFFDGSSMDFVKILKDFPVKENNEYLKINRNLFIRERNSFILFEPNGNELFIDMELNHPYIGEQKISIFVTKENYIKEIAPARTFVFTDESDPRLKNLPPYGIGITATKIYSTEPLRFPDEPVRHKILDLLGDLYILRKKLTGKIIARNTSHKLNLKFVKEILSIVG